MLFFTTKALLCADRALSDLKNREDTTMKNGLLAFILLFSMSATAQNLVPNPSFEMTERCPTPYGGMPYDLASNVTGWYTANCGSPDLISLDCGTEHALYNTLAPRALMFGEQYARTGNNYIDISHYGFCDYLGARLLEPLEANEAYEVKFYVSCGDNARYATDNIGIYFSTTEIKYQKLNGTSVPTGACLDGNRFDFVPQVRTTPGNFLIDYENWVEVSDIYVAAGGEEYITIGSFFPFSASHASVFDFGAGNAASPTATSSQARIVYFLDDVSIEKITMLPIKLVSFEGKNTDEGIKIEWKTASEINNCHFEIQRSENPHSFSTIGIVEGAINSSALEEYLFMDKQPLTTTAYYRLKQVDCDGKFEYSKIIAVDGVVPRMTIHPNPVRDEIRLQWERPGVYEVGMWNISGQEVIAPQSYSEQSFGIDVSHLVPGVYLLKAQYNGHSYTEKIIKR